MTCEIYGIKNCNTMKKAFLWLEGHGIPYHFHDYKKEGISTTQLQSWIDQVGTDALINKKGNTWRLLSDEEKEKIQNLSVALGIMQEKTSLIKRPVIELDGKITFLGFDEAAYSKIFL